jgi:hypothetical protein
VSPLYRFVDDVSGAVDRSVVSFSIGRARAEAWRFALELAAMDPTVAATRIAAQDRVVSRIGERVLHPGAMASAGLLGVRLTEKRRASDIIALFSDAALTHVDGT